MREHNPARRAGRIALIGNGSEINRDIRWLLEAVGYSVLFLEDPSTVVQELFKTPVELVVFGPGVMNAASERQLACRLKSLGTAAALPLVKIEGRFRPRVLLRTVGSLLAGRGLRPLGTAAS